MKNLKRMLSLLLIAAMVLGMLAACTGDKQDPTDGTEAPGTTEGTGDPKKSTYTVSVKSVGGLPLAKVDVYAYTDDAMTDIAGFAATNEEGIATLSLPSGGTYKIGLESLPEGYQAEASYAFKGNSAAISLTSAPVADKDVSGASLGLGDVMYDFTVTTSDGEQLTLSEVLQEKKMVLLNFWYVGCSWCVKEFPYMNEAYEQFNEDVEVIALNPMDDASAIAPFKEQKGLSFPMAACPPSWAMTFSLLNYPTSLIIDRYGVICLVEEGAITSLRPFTQIFEKFTADDYTQKLYNNVGELVSNVKPDVQMDTSENVAAILNKGDIPVTYRPSEGEDAEYAWPFVAGEKDGVTCLMSSNKEVGASYSIICIEVELEAGQALGFDYLISSELGSDIMHVIVDDQPVYSISGYDEVPQWEACYPCVAETTGTYEIVLSYIKDSDGDVGDDAVYIKDVRILDASEVDADTYLPRYAAVSLDGFEFTYADIVFNEKDGYYHVGSANGPLLLADLMGSTQFSEEGSIYDMALDGAFVINGHDYLEELTQYCSYASNSALNGVCTVNKELAELLKMVDQTVGFDDSDDNEWLKICKYYQAYGQNVKQLQDPIAGLCPQSAFTATLGKDVESNYFYYDRPILPRGLLAEFIPTKSGVYRITSKSESQNGVEGWIYNAKHEEILVYEHNERMYSDANNVSMLFYMEAGTPYYIDIAFWDMYEFGYIYYDVEYVAPDMEVFRLASPGYFTYDTDATGTDMYHTIAGGIDVVLGNDGLYYEDMGKDANGKQIYGSLLYCDFVGVTDLFSNPVTSVESVDENGDPVVIKGMIELGGFDFSMTDNDQYIKSILAQHDGDVKAADEYLQGLWGADYEAMAVEYQIEDVFEGKYHGTGEDMTAVIESYVDKIYNGSAEERVGCVVVDEELAEVLQMLMDKFTFAGVDHSWTKMCYYYDYLGPEA